MSSLWSNILGLLSLTAVGLLSYDLLLREPTIVSLAGLTLVCLSTIGYTLIVRSMRLNAFQTAMSSYADRQIIREAIPAQKTFDAPSAAA